MRPLIIIAFVIALIAAVLPASAQEDQVLSVQWRRVNSHSPIVIDRGAFRTARDPSADLLSTTDGCLTFHNTDARTAKAVRITLVFYDASGTRSGSQLVTRTGTFGTGVRQGIVNGILTTGACFRLHLPDSRQATIAYYVDSVDFADGSTWVADGLTMPDRVVAGTLIPVAPPPLVAVPGVAPVISAGFADCAATKNLPPAALAGAVFVDVAPGAPIGDGLFRIGSVSVCTPSGDAVRDARAVAAMQAFPAAILRGGAFRIAFPVLATTAACNAPVRVMDRKLVEPQYQLDDTPRAGEYIGVALVTVRSDGYAAGVRIERPAGRADFDAALRESAYSTRYWPAVQNGAFAESAYEFAMRFVIDGGTHAGELRAVRIFGPNATVLPINCVPAPAAA